MPKKYRIKKEENLDKQEAGDLNNSYSDWPDIEIPSGPYSHVDGEELLEFYINNDDDIK